MLHYELELDSTTSNYETNCPTIPVISKQEFTLIIQRRLYSADFVLDFCLVDFSGFSWI